MTNFVKIGSTHVNLDAVKGMKFKEFAENFKGVFLDTPIEVAAKMCGIEVDQAPKSDKKGKKDGE